MRTNRNWQSFLVSQPPLQQRQQYPKRKFPQPLGLLHISPSTRKILSIRRVMKRKRVSRLRDGTTMKMSWFLDLKPAEASVLAKIMRSPMAAMQLTRRSSRMLWRI